MGVPRKKIDWFPQIDFTKCNFCDLSPQCVKFCPHDVYLFSQTPLSLKIANPSNCVVFCRACSKVCSANAITFPQKSETIDEIRNLRAK